VPDDERAAAGLGCRSVVELLTDYLEGALPAPVHAAVDRHLAHCRDCRTYLAQLRTVIRLGAALRGEAPAPAAMPNLEAVFRDWGYAR
jgi:anti-sigma factor RsiW